MSEETAAWLLPQFIGTFVPLEIISMEERGGPTPEEFAQAKAYWLNLLDTGGGTELFFVEKGKTAETAGMLVKVIACMAFQEGGVEFMGHHFVAFVLEVS